MIVRELIALFGVKTDETSFKKAESTTTNLMGLAKKAVAVLGGFVAVRWAKGVIEQTAQAREALYNMSQRTGLSVQLLQQLEHVANLTGSSIYELQIGIRRLQKSQVDAADGSKELSKDFKRLGINIKNADGSLKNTTQLFFESADGFKNLKTDAERTATAIALFGRGGVQMVPMLKNGTAALREMMGEIEEYGALLSDDAVKAADDYMDNQRRLAMVTGTFGKLLANAAIPRINKVVSSLLKWWKANRKIIKEPIAKFFEALTGVLSGIVRVGGKFLSVAFGILSVLPTFYKVGLIALAFLKWEKGIQAVVGAFNILKNHPVLLFFLLLFLIVEDLMTWMEGGESVFGKFFESLDELTGLPISETIRDWLTWFGKLGTDPQGAIDSLFNSFKEFGHWMNVFFEDLTGYSLTEMFTLWYNGFTAFFVAIKETGAAIISFFQNVFSEPNKAWDTLLANIKASWFKAFEDIYKYVEMVFAWLPPLWEKYTGLLKENWNELKAYWGGVWDSMFAVITGWIDKVVGLLSGPLTKIKSIFGAIGGAIGSLLPKGAGAPAPTLSPKAVTMAPVGGGGHTFAPTANMSIQVNAAPGMSEETLANSVSRQVSRVLEKQNREAMQSLVPRKAAAI